MFSFYNFLYVKTTSKISRFLYSWIPNCDLRRLADTPTNQMTADEKEIWRRGRRLLNLRAGDFILHKNLPEREIDFNVTVREKIDITPDGVISGLF